MAYHDADSGQARMRGRDPRAVRSSPVSRAKSGHCKRVATSVTIRAARPGEMHRIKQLISIYPDDLLQDEIPRIPSFFVAEHRGEIVACCALQVYSRRLAEVRSLAVHPDYKGQGIAGRLVDACRERGRERNVRQLLAVTSQPSFFEKRGFSVYPGWKTALFANLDDPP